MVFWLEEQEEIRKLINNKMENALFILVFIKLAANVKALAMWRHSVLRLTEPMPIKELM
jgi:hypothetical protein